MGSSPSRRPVAGYEGLYEVGECGAVYSLPRQVYKKDGTPLYKTVGKILSPETTKWGYKRVILSKNGRARKHSVHRLVALHFIENPEDKPEVNHKDGNKAHNDMSNLEWATEGENATHAYATGLKSSDHVRIPDFIRDAVRAFYVKGSKTNGCVSTGLKFGIGKQTVMNIVKEVQ